MDIEERKAAWTEAVRRADVATERDEDRGTAETAQAFGTLSEATVLGMMVGAVNQPAFADALGEVLRAQVGMIPTAREIAAAIREYDADHGVPAEADRAEGHPVDPQDGLS